MATAKDRITDPEALTKVTDQKTTEQAIKRARQLGLIK